LLSRLKRLPDNTYRSFARNLARVWLRSISVKNGHVVVSPWVDKKIQDQSRAAHQEAERLTGYKMPDWDHMKYGHYQAAVLEFQECVRRDPDNREAYKALSQAYMDSNEFDKAQAIDAEIKKRWPE